MFSYDVIILGAGAAGLFCAAQAGQRGLKVLLIDHYPAVAEKIRISGGGRANFTNRDLDPSSPQKHFLSGNSHFCRSALARFTPGDFLALMQKHGIDFHEKHKGQLFCDGSAQELIDMLLAECQSAPVKGGLVDRWQPCRVSRVDHDPDKQIYTVDSDRGMVKASALVLATGGLSIPKLGATDFGWRLARQFGLRVIEPRPGLVPLTFDGDNWAPYASLAGLALPVAISTSESKGDSPPSGKSKKTRITFHEDLLFTHRGLSGPAVLQISSYWQPGAPISIDLAPGVDLAAELLAAKARGSRKLIANELTAWLPSRLADSWVNVNSAWQRPINEASDKALAQLAEQLSQWQLVPTGTEGYRKAEVTVGGVDTRDLSSQTMEAKNQPGLYCIGEVVDVTGWLGGYNFQWAWASAHACALAIEPGSTSQA
ncbi:NAD(P)/FAD-dependent oxidoreductase [Ottowia thiooxydans]|uniref:NAD(P)/FAD-dependent oxidoreductase n=1 Tax=Ottowia thiooxydans TaxID=219182 RepID=UPI0003F6811F|nr:NAD(P)/FAD-dependent oxidoreductase [Ottowia thiooxydans]